MDPNCKAMDEVRCRPCRKVYEVILLANPKRCPQCGGPTLTVSQLGGYNAATEQSLVKLRAESARIMRVVGIGMMSMQVMTYFFTDRQAATFFNDVVTGTTTMAAIATEIWAFTASRAWMIIGSVFIQAGAILYFFVATGFLSQFLPSRLATLIACLPLAGSLLAWHKFRDYSQVLRLHQKHS